MDKEGTNEKEGARNPNPQTGGSKEHRREWGSTN